MCFGRKPVDPESKKNEDIEKDLRADRKKAEREVKLLLLGMDATNRASRQASTDTLLQVLARAANPRF